MRAGGGREAERSTRRGDGRTWNRRGTTRNRPPGGRRGGVGRGAPPPAPAPAPASAEAAASDSSAGDRGNGSQAGEAAYYATTKAVNLRAAPSNAAAVLAVVSEGDVVRGIGREDDWLQFDHTDAGARNVTGWIYGSFLRRVEASPEGNGPPARAGG